MDAEMMTFVEQAALIGRSGRWAALNARIVELAADPGVDNAWQVQVFGGICSQTFHEYLRLKDAAEAERIDSPLTAWRARNLLELFVWATYFGMSRKNARRIYEDAGRDTKNIFDVFEKFGSAAEWKSTIADSKNDLLSRAANEGIATLDGSFMSVHNAAGECGFQDRFSVINKLLSKFAHPTAMRIVGVVDEATEILQRDSFYGFGCLYFVSAITALEACLPHIKPEPGGAG
jgi:hypothetical protein